MRFGRELLQLCLCGSKRQVMSGCNTFCDIHCASVVLTSTSTVYMLQVSTSSWSAVLVYLVWCLTHAEMVMTWFDIVRCTTGLTWSLRDVFLFDKVSPVQVSRSIEARNSNPIRISVDTMHLRSLRLSDFKTLTYGHIILTYFYHGLSSRQVCLKPLRNEPTLITACLGFHTSFSITRSWLTVHIHAWHSASFRSMSQLAPCSLLLRSLSWNACLKLDQGYA